MSADFRGEPRTNYELGPNDPIIDELAALMVAGAVEIGGDGNEEDGGNPAEKVSPVKPPEFEGAQPNSLESKLGGLALTGR